MLTGRGAGRGTVHSAILGAREMIAAISAYGAPVQTQMRGRVELDPSSPPVTKALLLLWLGGPASHCSGHLSTKASQGRGEKEQDWGRS